MKAWLTSLLVLILLVNAGGVGDSVAKAQPANASSRPNGAERATLSKKGDSKSPPQAEKAAPYQAFLVVEADTGQMVEGENIHQKCPPASIVKLMLAALVMDRLDSGQVKLEDPVTTSAEAASMGGSQVFLAPGEVFTLNEMMQAVMVASANDAAYAVAEHIAGSREEFVRLMNEKARQLEMTDTQFYSMHGLPPSQDQEPDVSSPHDLAILAREIVKHPQVLAWTSMKTAPFRGGTLIMRNHNNLMSRFSGMDGLKTGYYREAGYSIVATAKRNGLRMIAVVMGSPAAKVRDHVVEEKLKNAFARYEIVTVVKKGDAADREVALPDGKQKHLKPVAAAGFSYPVPRDRKKLLTKDVALPEQVKGEIKQGQRIGEIVFRFEGNEVGRVELVSPVHVPKLGFFERLFD